MLKTKKYFYIRSLTNNKYYYSVNGIIKKIFYKKNIL